MFASFDVFVVRYSHSCRKSYVTSILSGLDDVGARDKVGLALPPRLLPCGSTSAIATKAHATAAQWKLPALGPVAQSLHENCHLRECIDGVRLATLLRKCERAAACAIIRLRIARHHGKVILRNRDTCLGGWKICSE